MTTDPGTVTRPSSETADEMPRARPPTPKRPVRRRKRCSPGSPAGAAPPPTPVVRDAEGPASLPVRLSTGPEQPRVRMRQRIARFGAAQDRRRPVLDPLFKVIRASHPKADLSLDRAGLPDRRALPPGSDPAQRRRLHHPPAGGDHDPGRARADRADAVRRAAARHRRGHLVHAVRADPRLRRGDRPPGRRLHQARQGQVRRVGQVGDHPQDGRGDVAGHPGAGHQAGRPAAQHAHAALPAARQAAPDRVRDAGDLRPAGPPPGHERDQVGARGPRPSRPCSPRSTTRSSGWSPRPRPAGTSSCPR